VRLIKMFGLTAIAVGAFMAFLGATSASAVTSLEEVVLCKTSADPCGAKEHLTSGAVLKGTSIGEPDLLGGFGVTVLCTSSATKGKTTSLLAHGEIEELTFTGCKENGGTACTATAVAARLPYLVKGELNSAHNGYEALVTPGPSGLRPEVRLVCASIGIDCNYGADNVLFETLNSGTSGEMDMVWDVLQTLSGLGFCFTSAVWHAKYLVRCLQPANTLVSCLAAMENGSVLKTP
jgi:hypothetical protein